jgi:hypothetical protein
MLDHISTRRGGTKMKITVKKVEKVEATGKIVPGIS